MCQSVGNTWAEGGIWVFKGPQARNAQGNDDQTIYILYMHVSPIHIHTHSHAFTGWHRQSQTLSCAHMYPICTNTYLHTRTPAHTLTYPPALTQTHPNSTTFPPTSHPSSYSSIQTHTVHPHTLTYTHTHTHTCTHRYRHTHMHLHRHTRPYTHTHRHALSLYPHNRHILLDLMWLGEWVNDYWMYVQEHGRVHGRVHGWLHGRVISKFMGECIVVLYGGWGSVWGRS